MRHHCPPFLKPSAAGFVTVCLILSATFSVDDSGHYPADLPGLRAETLGGADKLRAVFIALIQERVLEVQQRRCLEHPVVDDQLAGPVVRDRIVHHALCNIIEPIFDKAFIYDSCANRNAYWKLDKPILCKCIS